MFCPKCSQQQISDETRFCSRCGFQLGAVKDLLVNEDAPQLQTTEIKAIDRSLRRRDRTFGALYMFIFALAVAVITVDMPSSHSARIILLVIAWFGLSLLLNIKPILRYFFNADASTEENISAPKFISGFTSRFTKKTANPALPSAYSIPASDFVTDRINTAEIVQPPSVTEKTTNLLNENQKFD